MKPPPVARLEELLPVPRWLLLSVTGAVLIGGTSLFGDDDTPRDLFLVRSGFLRASQRDPDGMGPGRERVLTYFREGTVFGVLPLLWAFVIYPPLVSVAAHESKRIRIGTQAQSRALEAAYRLFVEELPDESSAPNGGRAIQVRARIGIAVETEANRPGLRERLRILERG